MGNDINSELRARLAGRFASGDITDADGTVLGRHQGLPFFTVGQRAGLGIAPSNPDTAPRYVIELIPERNTVVVGPREGGAPAPRHRRGGFVPVDRGEPTAGRDAVRGAAASPWDGAPGADRDQQRERRGTRSFDAPVDQAAPGQSLVLYRGDEILGGGLIRRAA